MTSNSDRIAICGDYYPRALKRHLLFFDRIGVTSIDEAIFGLRTIGLEDTFDLANDLEFLQSKNVVFDIPDFLKDEKVAEFVDSTDCQSALEWDPLSASKRGSD